VAEQMDSPVEAEARREADEDRVFRRTPGTKGPRAVWRVAAQPLELKRVAALVAIVAVAALIVLRFDSVMKIFGTIWGIAVPLLVGACFAYLLNFLMWKMISLSMPPLP